MTPKPGSIRFQNRTKEVNVDEKAALGPTKDKSQRPKTNLDFSKIPAEPIKCMWILGKNSSQRNIESPRKVLSSRTKTVQVKSRMAYDCSFAFSSPSHNNNILHVFSHTRCW
jgi:hypothetical protein